MSKQYTNFAKDRAIQIVDAFYGSKALLKVEIENAIRQASGFSLPTEKEQKKGRNEAILNQSYIWEGEIAVFAVGFNAGVAWFKEWLEGRRK